jgi:4,5-DOPA dioxygenase extradiol
MTAIENGKFQDDLNQFGKKLSSSSSIVVLSAHWEKTLPLSIISTPTPKMIYDFYGFPEALYQIDYKVEGNPKLAKEIADLLSSHGWQYNLESNRGLDHGSWIPLRIMLPTPDIPVIQISLPIPRKPTDLYRIGQALSPLRKEGVAFMGSGNLVHNLPHVNRQASLGKLDFQNMSSAPIEPWAKEVDSWIADQLENLEIERLLRAPDLIANYKMAAPTSEHFDPLYFVLGLLEKGEGIKTIHESIQGGSISMRCFSAE